MNYQINSANLWIIRLTTILACCILLPKSSLSADKFVDAGPDSWWSRRGLFCFRVSSDTNIEVHLARYRDGKFDEAFAKHIGRTVKTPICFSNGVVIVSAEGIIQRLDLKGDTVFIEKPSGFVGAAGWSGRVGNKGIFMTETTYQGEKRDIKYQLHIIDIAGTTPVVRATYKIDRPLRVMEVDDEMIVIEPTNVFRVKLPDH